MRDIRNLLQVCVSTHEVPFWAWGEHPKITTERVSSVINTYHTKMSHKMSQCGASSLQTQYHILVMSQSVTVNTRASWHPAATFSNCCQIKEQHAFYCCLRQSHHENHRKFTSKAAGEKQAVKTSCVVHLSFSRADTHATNIIAAAAAWEPIAWANCCLQPQIMWFFFFNDLIGV